jgi:CubicO group peptidase (beta-lactamase class C family)
MTAHGKPPERPDDPDATEDKAGVEAYESDWYRSLQALSKRGETGGASEADTPAEVAPDAARPRKKAGEPAAPDDEDEDEEGDDERHPASDPGEPGLWVVVTPDR